MYNSWSEWLSASEPTRSLTRPSLLNNRDSLPQFQSKKKADWVRWTPKNVSRSRWGRFKVSFREESRFLVERSRVPALFEKPQRSPESVAGAAAALFKGADTIQRSAACDLWPCNRGWEHGGWWTPHPSPFHMKVWGAKKKKEKNPGGRLRQDLVTVSHSSPGQRLKWKLLKVHVGEPSG